MNITETPIEKIIPYENNPRHNEAAIDAVAASIREFGFKVPIVIDRDGVIVAGHTRVAAARRLGLETVPAIIADDLTDEQIKAFRLADNRTAELAGWDEDLLAEELAAIADIDMTQFGFEIPEEEGEIQEDDFDPDEIPEEAESQLGEIYALGNHRLMVGDSTKAQDVKALMDGATADLFLTDPPYNVALGQHMRPSELRILHRRTDGLVIENDEFKNDADFIEFLNKAFRNGLDSIRPGAAFYIWFASNQSANFLAGAAKAGMTIRQHLVWVKSIFAMGRQDYQWRHEPCLYGWKDGAAHYFVDDRTISTVIDDTPDFDKMKKEDAIALLKSIYQETTVLYEKKPSKSELHPTMKPIGLFGKLIRNSTKTGDKILDLFGGSGTTIMAAEQLNRTAYTMEFDPHYADVIIRRWEEYTGRKAERIREADPKTE